jgi:hypothetical protein
MSTDLAHNRKSYLLVRNVHSATAVPEHHALSPWNTNKQVNAPLAISILPLLALTQHSSLGLSSPAGHSKDLGIFARHGAQLNIDHHGSLAPITWIHAQYLLCHDLPAPIVNLLW